MIYTLTVNPALDYTMKLSGDFTIGETNRSCFEEYTFGGKGLNVSYVLKELNTDNTALGFYAGFTGEEILRLANKSGIKTDFIRLEKGASRINVKIKGEKETEINATGPEISKEAVDELFKKLDKITDGDGLILSGSVPKNLGDNFYAEILNRLKDKNLLTVVDATGKLLTNALCYNPFLIKPNLEELKELFGDNISVEVGAKRLKEMGAENVLISLGGLGAYLLAEDGTEYRIKAPKGKVINTVGAGDSMVAGFIAEYIKTKDVSSALKMGISAGSATAFSSSLATADEINHIFGGALNE